MKNYAGCHYHGQQMYPQSHGIVLMDRANDPRATVALAVCLVQIICSDVYVIIIIDGA
jgi:hypothetical protein